MTSHTGTVYLIGSGPGQVAFLTLRGYQLLRHADVLIYDALVDPDLLSSVPAHCLKLDVGKRGGEPSPSQTEINQLLVEQAQQGRQVVRLKSGDPFIFGRCTSEIEALVAAGCPFEVVPGISSALAAPLFAGIPLTDPVLSRCFAVLSAHDPDALDWEDLAGIDTLVILMGARHLPEILDALQRHGRSPQTPIAIIRWAGQSQQQIWDGTLATITQQTSRQPLSPCVMVIGEVVRLRPFLQSPALQSLISPPTASGCYHPSDIAMISPSSSLPLTGKTVLVTRAAGQSSQFRTLLEAQGATVLEMPTLEITPPSSWQALDQAMTTLEHFNWLILTSANGVDYFFERLKTHGKDARALAGVNIAVVGKKTAASLQQHGITPDFIPPDFVADALVDHFPVQDLAGVKMLFPRVESGGRDVLVRELTHKGAEVTEVPAYESGCAQTLDPAVMAALEQEAIDIITFASSKTVKCFAQILNTAGRWQPQACIAAIGPQTSASCQEYLGRVDIEAEDYTLEGLIQAIVKWVSAPDD